MVKIVGVLAILGILLMVLGPLMLYSLKIKPKKWYNYKIQSPYQAGMVTR